MPSKKQYNLVNDDAYDSRIPLHSEEAFQHGISFQAKYVGTLDVPRPSSRVEIVAAMRRIRYEFKAKGIKKKKVFITVSVDGVKVNLRKKQKKNQWPWDDSKLMLMHHPIYRIFYVSHDSQDLKIFSYIARDGGSNVFKCNVFKSNKKSQAMRIVRTIGQAFEVCHKLSLAHATSTVDSQEDIPCEKSNEALCETSNKGKPEVHRVPESNSCDTQMEDNRGASNESTVQRPTKLETLAPPASESGLRNASELGETYTSPLSEPLPLLGTLPPEGTPLSLYHQVQLLRHQLEQQSQQTQAAIAQVQLLKDQLSAETAARLEAQAQNHQLLVHNKELLDHIHVLVKQIQELEKKQQEGKADVVLPELPSVSEGVQPLHGRVTTTNSWHLPEIVPTTARSTSLDNTLNISQGYESRTPKDTVSFSSLQNSTSQLRTSSSPSGSPRLTSLTDEKTSLFLSGLPFTSSPTRLTFARTTDDILKSQRVDSSQSRTRSPSSSQPSEDSLSNLTSLQLGDSSATFPVPVSAPPQLNPPPQKLRNTKASEPAVTSKQGKVSTKSTGMDEIIGRSISYQETSQRPDLVSWPSSQFSTNQLTTSAIHASLSRQNSQPAYQYSEQDSYTTQIDRDIGRLNLQEKERDYLRISDSLFSQKDDSMQMLFKS